MPPLTILKPLTHTLFCLSLLCLPLSGCSDNNNSDNSTNTSPQSSSSSTLNNETYTEGVHYNTLKDPIVNSSENIVVTEFFWYGCSHCANFEPLLQQWDKTKPTGVSLVQSPAMWNDAMKLHAKVFFVAQTLGNADKLHAQLFTTIMGLHGQKNLEKHKETIASVFQTYGLEKDAFYAQIDSFKTKGQLSLAAKKMKLAQLKGTPLIVVNGKYPINNGSIKSAAELLTITNFLIAKEQASIKK
ncbi:MAG: thiol:disulfide interchange protein DsbA/DsbL [Pseudomonadales bacterium]|nr:thiol:disulfide interchange protein DsbA/DsbL [Pseudomonadales bacterium]